MPRIFVLTGPDVGLERDVAEGAVFGRGDDCAIHLRDASVSRQHARLERQGNGYQVVDLGSRNGIATEFGRAEKIPVSHGTEFFVGSVRMRFLDAAPAEVEELELDAAPAAEVAAGGAPAPKGGAVPARPRAGVEVGAARRRAIATKEGVLQFERIEGKDASLFRDDLSQQSPLAKILLVIAALALAGGLGYGVYRITAAATPEGGGAPAEPR